MSENITIKIPKGIYANGTARNQKGRWNKGNFVRWIDDAIRPIGGVRRWVTVNQPSKKWRGIHSWLDLSKTKWLAFGAYNQFKASKGAGDVFYDLTPHDLVAGREDADYEDGYGYGFYGNGTYGMPISQNQDGQLDPVTTWSIDNFGEVLIACSSDDGRIFDWDLDTVGGANLLANGDFSLGFGTIAGSNGGLGGGGWVEAGPGAGSNSGWEIDTTTNTATFLGNTTFASNTYMKNVVKGLTVGKRYKFRVATVEDNDLNVSIKNANGSFETNVLTGNSIFRSLYLNSLNEYQPEFDATTTEVTIELYGDTFASQSPQDDTTISGCSLRALPVLTPISNAPTNNKSILVTDERFVFALGSGGNPRKVAWSDREDRNTWAPLATNEAGDLEISDVGDIMCGVKTKGQTVVLTTTSAHSFKYTGPPYVYSTSIVGQNCGVISAKAAANTEVGVFWMGDNGFFYFDGNVVRDLKCEVHDHVFQDINMGQKSKIFCWVNSRYNEIWWHYLSASTIESPNPNIVFEEPEKYVSYNYAENYWMVGDLGSGRTAGMDRGVFQYPMLMYNLGLVNFPSTAYIFEHEVGTSLSDGAYVESGAIELGEADNVMKVLNAYPSIEEPSDASIALSVRQHEGDNWSYMHNVNDGTGKENVRFTGRQLKMRINGEADTDWRVGDLRLEVKKGGKR